MEFQWKTMRNLNVSKVTSSHSKRTVGLQPPKMLVLTPKKHTHFNQIQSSSILKNVWKLKFWPPNIGKDAGLHLNCPVSRNNRATALGEIQTPPCGRRSSWSRELWGCSTPSLALSDSRDCQVSPEGNFFNEVLLGFTNRNSQRSPAKRTYFSFVLVDKSTSWWVGGDLTKKTCEKYGLMMIDPQLI